MILNSYPKSDLVDLALTFQEREDVEDQSLLYIKNGSGREAYARLKM
jgi:hypothetical protein